MDGILQALAALAPSVGVGLIFFYVMRAVTQADRRERQALARLDAEEAARARAASVPTPPASVDPAGPSASA